MYPIAVVFLFWARDLGYVVCRSWLPCHISKTWSTLAIWCNVLSSATFFTSESLSVFVVSNAGSSPAVILLLAWAHCLTMTFSRRVSPVVFDCLQLITPCPRENLTSTPTPCGMRENIPFATSERSAYFECVSSGWCHQLFMSGIQICSANFHWVGVVIVEIWINLPSVVWCFWGWIQIEPGSGQ